MTKIERPFMLPPFFCYELIKSMVDLNWNFSLLFLGTYGNNWCNCEVQYILKFRLQGRHSTFSAL